MAAGQLSYLRLTNSVLRRLGKAQVTTLAGITSDTDSWTAIVKDTLNEAQGEVSKEHDWSTLVTSGTFTTSDRTYNLATSFSNFGREIDLVSTTNDKVLTPVTSLPILDMADSDLDDAGSPDRYAIHYPNLLFDLTPTSEAYRIRYVKRPTALSANADVSELPEYCDMALVWWTYWQLQATREDAADGGKMAERNYNTTLARAIGQDRRRMDRVYRLKSVYPTSALGPIIARWPSTYGYPAD
jgi:hypothetical protein